MTCEGELLCGRMCFRCSLLALPISLANTLPDGARAFVQDYNNCLWLQDMMYIEILHVFARMYVIVIIVQDVFYIYMFCPVLPIVGPCWTGFHIL